MKDFKDRLAKARAQKGLSQAALGDLVGAAQSTVASWERGQNEPDFRAVVRLAKALGVSPAALAFGDQAGSDATYALVPAYQKSKVANAKGPQDGNLGAQYHVALPRAWLEGVTRAAPEDIAIVEAEGQAMAPTIGDGDSLIVDLSQKRVESDGIYVIDVTREVIVRRVTVDPVRKRALIAADNPAHKPPEPVPLADLAVFGRVIVVGRRV